MNSTTPPARYPKSKRIAALALLLAAARMGPQQQQRPQTAAPGSVDFASNLGEVDGFGFSEAFGQADTLRRLPADRRRELLDLLFRRDTGAGFTIVRLGIDAGTTLEAADPGGPSAKPKYSFDGSDGGQVWLAEQAQRYGVSNFMADAWTAPAFMKDNHAKIGGTLCGLTVAGCDNADWTHAFSNYLLQYVRYYRELRIPIGALGFSNEPDANVVYESMKMTPAQAVQMLRVFGPAVRASGLDLRITCCDATTWTGAGNYTAAIEADPVKQYVDLYTAHQYGVHAASPLPTTLPVWMTEWSSGLPSFFSSWDCNGCANGPDGMYLAQDVVQAFAQGHINAYVFWWAAGDAPATLIQTTADATTIAKRFYALAMVSRFVLPGAVRVAAESPDPEVRVAGFRNPSGGRVLVLVNLAHTPKQMRFRVDPDSAHATVRTILTDSAQSMAETSARGLTDGILSVPMPRRSMTTVLLSPATTPGPAKLEAEVRLARLGDGSYQAEVKVTNQGPGSTQNVRLEGGMLGTTTADARIEPGAAADLPRELGDLAAGGWVTTTLHFSAAAGRPGRHVAAVVTGHSGTKTFRSQLQLVLP